MRLTLKQAETILTAVFHGHPRRPVIDPDGHLNDGKFDEPANLSSEAAFRAQLKTWIDDRPEDEDEDGADCGTGLG